MTEDPEYIDDMKREFTRFVPSFQHMPAYKSGRWNGTTCVIRNDNSFPYGLLFDFIRAHKKLYPQRQLMVGEKAKRMFKGDKIEPNYNLSLYPYPYQRECIESIFQRTKGIIRSATASGKSLVITYVVKELLAKKKAEKSLIVVPTQSLVEQFYEDMLEYGIPERLIGRVYEKYKDWDNRIVISTWQTLSRNHGKLNDFDILIMDECHMTKAYELKKILAKAIRPQYRIGFTGTLHAGELDNWNVKSYLGPVLKDFPSGLLAEDGYISKCNINMVNIEYADEFDGTYNDVKDNVFQTPYRLQVMADLVKNLDHNVLILVGKVEKEGEFLKEYLLSQGLSKQIIFLSGRDDSSLREKWRKNFAKRSNIVLIATYGIFKQGINIPNLKYLVLGSPFKSKITVLQSIGRALRKHAEKEDGAYIFDIHDHTKYLEKHGLIRLRYYDSEKFNVKEFVFEQGMPVDTSILFES